MDTKKLFIFDLKWRKLKKMSFIFSFVPFIDFVLVSGSMATGEVDEFSDFDVLISVKKGRIFLTRYIINFLFSIIGQRRKDDFKNSSPNKFCFNHFITQKSWELKPFDDYGPVIYKNLVPLWGDEKKIIEFFRRNLIYNPNLEENIYDLRYNKKPKFVFAKFLEKIGSGRLGDFFEKIARLVATKRLNKYLKTKKGGRFIISDEELEFHFYQ